MCSVPIELWPSESASRSESSSATFACGVNGICPAGASSPPADDAGYACARVVGRNPERFEHLRAEPLLLAQDPEQEMLRPDVAVPERARLVLTQRYDLSRPLGEALEHPPR